MAPSYDWKIAIFEAMSGARAVRRELLNRASGNVLDVACGTGRNFAYYPSECRITGVDLSPGMLAQARYRAETLGRDVQLFEQNTEALTLPDRSYDTVVSSLSVCTYPHPIQALQEMARVCRADGQILLLEHGRSSVGILGALQDRFAARYARHTGCHLNREPLELAQAAGLRIVQSRRTFLGILHAIQTQPPYPITACSNDQACQ